MNKLQEIVNSFRQAFGPVSPVPPDNGQYLRDQASAVGQDLIGGVRGAVNLSPPKVLLNRVNTFNAYTRNLPQGQVNLVAVPASEGVIQAKQGARDVIDAVKGVGYANVPLVAAGAVGGGLLATVNELIRDGAINKNDGLNIVGNALKGARVGAGLGSAKAVAPIENTAVSAIEGADKMIYPFIKNTTITKTIKDGPFEKLLRYKPFDRTKYVGK
jgi:hypothetical protein